MSSAAESFQAKNQTAAASRHCKDNLRIVSSTISKPASELAVDLTIFLTSVVNAVFCLDTNNVIAKQITSNNFTSQKRTNT